MKRTLVAVAVSFVALTASWPARADMLYLVCRYPKAENPRFVKAADTKLDIDLTNNTVTGEYGVYPATISATSIYYKMDFTNTNPHQVQEIHIDRTKGTIAWSSYMYTNVTIPGATYIGHCTSSATPPRTKF